MIEENIRRFPVVVAVKLASLAFAFAWLLHDAGVLGWWLVRSKHCVIVILHAFYLRFCFPFGFVGGIGGPSSPMFNRVGPRPFIGVILLPDTRRLPTALPEFGDTFALPLGTGFPPKNNGISYFALPTVLMIRFLAVGFWVLSTFDVATG